MSNTGQIMLLYLSQNINGFLTANNCTEVEAARGSGLKISTLNSWICQKAYPRWKNLIKLADYFGCPLYELIEDPDKRDKSQRFLTQWQRSLLKIDQSSPSMHKILLELYNTQDEMDEETLSRILTYIKAANKIES